MSFRPRKRNKDGRLQGRSTLKQQGMTLAELAMASMFVALFTGVVIAVSELQLTMMSGDQRSKSTADCAASPLDRACIDLVFDDLVQTLEQPTFSVQNLRQAVRQCKPTAAELFKLNFDQLPVGSWPTEYEICLYDYGSVNGAFVEDLRAQKPGLYLLQAQPIQPMPYDRPVQRLFCRPRTLCG